MEEPEQRSWYTLNTTEVFEALDSNEEGLTDAQAKERLRTYGPNTFVQKEPIRLIDLIVDHLKNPMVLILFLAALLSLILNEYVEAVVILTIIVLDTILGVMQEKKANNALEALAKMSAPIAKVLREEEVSLIPAQDIVPGDYVYLEAGDIVPADIRLHEVNDLYVLESALTGESLPIEKNEWVIKKDAIPVGDRNNMAYMSTIVTAGNGWGMVCNTGSSTEVGNIATSIEEVEVENTILEKKLNNLTKMLAIIGLIVCAVVLILGMAKGMVLIPLIMTAISLSISIIPEGLPATATIVMSLGVERMAKKNALIKGLPNVETIGSATVICSDKTGTLTENKMQVVEVFGFDDLSKEKSIFNKDNPIHENIAKIGLICNNASLDPDNPGGIIGDPTEGALIKLAQEIYEDIETYQELFEKIDEEPFDSDRKRMSVLVEEGNKSFVFVKGAVEEVLKVSTHVETIEGIVPLTSTMQDEILVQNDKMASKAYRVLALAYKNTDNSDLESNLTFVGLVGIIDPPRSEVIESIKVFKDAGIRVVMITGDHPQTALAIAKELGIHNPKDLILTSQDLQEMSDASLKEVIQKVTVFSRVSPQEKLRIVRILNELNEVTAMTGDGVNDSPALKEASIGIAMGSGTEVSKDAADMILLDDNFTTIESAIQEGRRIYQNMKKVIQFLVAGNVAEILTILFALIVGWQQPILAIHILLINLVTDNIPAIALGVEPFDRKDMKKNPEGKGDIFDRAFFTRIVIHGIFITIAALLAYYIGITYYNSEVAMTLTFYVLAISQLFHALNQRSLSASVFKNKVHNKWLNLSLLFSGIVLAVLMLWDTMRNYFSLVWLDGTMWLIVGALSLLPLFLVEIHKMILRQKQNQR